MTSSDGDPGTGSEEGFPLGPALLFCPGDRPERYAKAAARADAVILDLEDAVAEENKRQARAAVTDFLTESDPALLAHTVVRVNAAQTPEFPDDTAALAQTRVQFLMLPKTESAEQIDDVVRAVPQVAVVALIETAAGVLAAEQIAAHPHVVAVMWGAEDLIASMGGTSSRASDGRYREVTVHARSTVLMAAAAHRTAAIDAICADIGDVQTLQREAEDAVASGFTAKACIHPSQSEVIRTAFRPNEEQVAYARALLEELPHHGGVFSFRGAMVDGPLIRHAEQILRRSRT